MRNYERLEKWANRHTKFKPKDQQLKYLIMSSLFQIKHMDSGTTNTIIYSAAATTPAINRAWAKNVVYAALKRACKEAEPEVNNMPKWLEQKILTRFGHQGVTTCHQAWTHQPEHIHIRVNRQKETRGAYLEKLLNTGIKASECSRAPYSIIAPSKDICRLPGLNQGTIYIQDSTHQNIAQQLPKLRDNAYVLDACAAPGGKSTAILEQDPNIKLLALDISNEKTAILKSNLQTYPQAVIQQADATQSDTWWNGTPFDAIICDAPCSGSAIIQKHPEIKRIQCPENIQYLQETQITLLKSLWKTLGNGGFLLYSTCSILPEENEDCINALLSAQGSEAKLIQSEVFLPSQVYAGGYYALIEKRGATELSTKLSTSTANKGAVE